MELNKRFVLSILALPFNVTVTVPLILLLVFGHDRWNEPWATLAEGTGILLYFGGAYLFLRTVLLFGRVGDGTLAPWDPPVRLVVRGPYRHVRNPMMLSVFGMLLGIGLMATSAAIFVYLVVGAVMTLLMIFFVEEPKLVARYGDEYQEYRKNVPAWVPRRDPWYVEPEPMPEEEAL